MINTGKLHALEELLKKTPPGILEMLQVKGIGPKKIYTIWKEMEIENIGELLYACHENRLLLYKGFGKKTQDNVIESIEFYEQQQGNYLFAAVESLGNELTTYLQNKFSNKKIKITGEYFRHAETISVLEFVIPVLPGKIIDTLCKEQEFKILQENEDHLLYNYDERIKVKLFFSPENQ